MKELVYFLIVTLVSLSTLAVAIVTKVQFSNSNDIPIDSNLENSPFMKIGEKYYYIEQIKRLNWFNAAHRCRDLGGNLLNIENENEFNLLHNYLDKSSSYWTSGNDLGQSSAFYSLTTGKPMTFLKWGAGEPNLQNDIKCIGLHKSHNLLMAKWSCSVESFFVCEANSPRTLSITVW